MVEAETGFRTCGILYIGDAEEDLERYRRWIGFSREYQIASSLLTPDDVTQLVPGLRRPKAGGLYTANDGRAEPQKAVPAMANALQMRGGKVVTSCAVRGVETAAGRVSGVVTEKGRIACSTVVLAGGAWSRLFCGNLGVDLPQLKILGTVLRTQPIDDGPDISVGARNVAFRRRLDGGYTVAHGFNSAVPITPDSFLLARKFLPALRREWRALHLRFGPLFFEELVRPRSWPLDGPSPFEKSRVFDPEPQRGAVAGAMAQLRRMHPAFSKAIVTQSWGGMIDVTPDAVPIISGIDAVPGFFVATGFSGHGFGIGPAAGKLMADLVMGNMPVVDPSPFRFSRFDGSAPIVIDAGF